MSLVKRGIVGWVSGLLVEVNAVHSSWTGKRDGKTETDSWWILKQPKVMERFLGLGWVSLSSFKTRCSASPQVVWWFGGLVVSLLPLEAGPAQIPTHATHLKVLVEVLYTWTGWV